MTLIMVLLGLIALLLAGLVIAVAIYWWREHQDRRPLREFSAAIRAAHRAMAVQDPYSVPRVLATGAPAALEALCRNWRLTPDSEPGWYGRVWHDAEGLIVAEPHDMLAATSASRQVGAWRRLLRALLRNRPGRPLDAILWVIAADTLVGDDGKPREAGVEAIESSRTVLALQRQFGMTLPLFVVVSGCDALPGFDALAAGLGRTEGSTPFGWASPYAPKRIYAESWIDEAFGSMRAALTETITELGTLNGKLDASLFLLPQRIDTLRMPLRDRIEPTLRGAADGTAPFLRGIYCVGAVPSRRSPSVAIRAPGDAYTGTPTPAFAARLWQDVLLAGQGLASPIPRVLALRMRRYRVATVAAAVLAVCWCVGLGVSFWRMRGDALALASAYDSLTLAQTTYRESDKSRAAASAAIDTVANALMDVPRWRLTSPFMPLSYLTSGREWGDAQLHMLRGLVFTPLHDRLVARLAQMTCTSHDDASTDVAALATRQPQDLPEFKTGSQLVANAAQVEHMIAIYNKLVQAGSGNAAMLAQLMREAADVNLSLDRIADREGMDDAVRTSSTEGGMVSLVGRDVSAARQHVSVCFEGLFDAWFDHVYSDSTLSVNAGKVQAALTELKTPGTVPTKASLAELADRIDLLATQVDAADHGWAGARGKELVPGLTATFDTAQRLRLIGEAPVESVLAHEAAAQNAFSARWLASGNLPGVLSASPSSGLQLAADLPPLRDSLRTLLAQPFAAVSSDSSAGIRNVDVSTVQQALAVLPGYRQYVAEPLAKAPDAYRGALLAAAGNSAVTSMVSALSTPGLATMAHDTSSPTDAAQQFDTLRKNALDLIAAFDSLGRHDLATSVALQVSNAALAVLRTADAQLQSLAPFRPLHGDFSSWDGSQGGALRAFGATTPQALQTYLAAQSAAVADTATNAASALDWLNAQKPPLGPADARMVSRWQALTADLVQFRAKSPASAMVAVPLIISDRLDKLDLANCSASLDQVDVPAAGDIVASTGARLVSSAREQCFRLQMGNGTQAYEQIRSYFDRYLAGRFPFAADAGAPGADLRQTAAFVALLDRHLADAQRGLAAAAAIGRGSTDSEQFVAKLVNAKPWLDALVARGADGMLQGIEVSVDWRVDRADEIGADQVIEWKLVSGNDSVTYPSSGGPPARWSPGLPVSVSLRWAKDGPWQPMFDAAQPTLASQGGVATWSAGDAWALLRVVRLHQMPVDAATASAGQPPRMLLTIPVRDRSGAIQSARMFMRIGYVGAAKTPQAIPDLPYGTPGMIGPGASVVSYPASVRTGMAGNE